MFCAKCGQLYWACRCSWRSLTPPPPARLKMPGEREPFGSVDMETGQISAPGEPYHGMKMGPLGQIPGTNLRLGPAGLVEKAPAGMPVWDSEEQTEEVALIFE